MSDPYAQISNRVTPQSEPIFGEVQVKNAAGGYVYGLDPLKTLERFLVLGTEGGTYYVSEQKLTRDAAKGVVDAIDSYGIRAVDLIVGISESGRAVKNDPAIFALALCAAAKDPRTRAYALAQLGRVCRIPTHLFHFVTYVRGFRGFGRGLKRAIGDWYQNLPVDKLAYEVVKYQSRDGWSNRDLLRLSHPMTTDLARNAVYRWVVDGIEEVRKRELPVNPTIGCFESAKNATTKELVTLIREANLSREMLPTESLKKVEIWEALLDKMPINAMLRNLGNMGKSGLLAPLSDASRKVIAKLADRDSLKKSRVHPISILMALKVYGLGHGILGSGTWPVVASVLDALDDAFYAAFDYVEPTGKSMLVAIDVSGSMNAQISGVPMTAAEGAAAMALATIKVEPNYEIVCFDTQVKRTLILNKRMGLKDLARLIPHGGSTDCAAPIAWATTNKIKADGIVILTDNETWAGRFGHPSQVMRTYREKVNANAKIVNLGMTATTYTCNDPSDRKAIDIAGFDASVPAVVAEFMKL